MYIKNELPIQSDFKKHFRRLIMKKTAILLFLVLLVFTGCTYPLTITNEQNFASSGLVNAKGIKVGFLPTEDKLANSVIEEIALNSSVEKVKKGHALGSDNDIDYACSLSTTVKYRADGQNFLITFPGFLVFTHAWLGYKYYIDIETKSQLLDRTGKVLNDQTIITPYEIRYTSFTRGAVSSLVGWFTPGWGLLDIIPGVLYSNEYDDRANSEFFEKVKPSYKAFVARKVLDQISGLNAGNSAGNTFMMKPQVISMENPLKAEDKTATLN